MERPMPFPGWTLPGVMGIGAAQTLLKSSGLLPEGRVVIAGTGPLVYLYARQILSAGGRPIAILDTSPAMPPAGAWSQLARAAMTMPGALRKGRGWLREIRDAGIPHHRGIRRFLARGDRAITAVEYRDENNEVKHIACDLLLVHDGVIPNTHLSMAADCHHIWNPTQRYWRPEVNSMGLSTAGGIAICGDQAGILGADAATPGGRVTGLAVANQLQLIDDRKLNSDTATDLARLRKLSILRRFLDAYYLPFEFCQVPPDDDTIICRCEQVSAGELRTVAAHGCMGPNQGKAFTRCGMGACMGRYCGNTVSQVLASHHGKSVDAIGHYRIRPPVRPISVGDLALME
jgi:NADPH-dependent 2,4-dienoyl-CoA reductase/sulfur reductase-like enzyme